MRKYYDVLVGCGGGTISKPYFAKYLPVEGEIKMGDKFFEPGLGIGTRRNKEGLYDFQKVKLFLCSIDIQLGDKVICPDPYHRGTPEDFEITSYDQFNGWMGKNPKVNNGEPIYMNGQTFKVIGEISPDATLVKEGDEFGEEDIRIVEICPHYGGKHMWKDCSCKSGFIKGVYIKCSFGHFH